MKKKTKEYIEQLIDELTCDDNQPMISELEEILKIEKSSKLEREKQIIKDFLENEIENLVNILGKDHPYEYIGGTVGDVSKAFYKLLNEKIL